MTRWKMFKDAHGTNWYRTTDGRWEVRRRLEVVWRRTPIGADNADEPTTDWTTRDDACHLDAELQTRYPPPPRTPKPAKYRRPSNSRRNQIAATLTTCATCRKPIYANGAGEWCHRDGDDWYRPHPATPKPDNTEEVRDQ